MKTSGSTGGGNRSRLLFCILTLFWMSLIFLFSSQPGEESTQVSTWVGRSIGNLVVPGFRDAPFPEQEAWALQIDFYVRKGAHFSVYLILGLLLCASYRSFRPQDSLRIRMLVPLILGILYASSDEFHQLFVPGRSGQIRDVCIDSAGVLSGILIFSLFMYGIQRFCTKKEQNGKKKETSH